MNKKTIFTIIIIAAFGLSLITRDYLSLIFTIPFFVLVLVYFRTDKLMITFAAFSIATLFVSSTIMFRAQFFIGAFLSIIALLASFAIGLQEKYKPIFRYSLVYIAIVYFALYSTIMFVLNYMLRSLIGNTSYTIFYITLMIGVMISEIICIRYLIDYDKYERNRNSHKTSYTFVDGEWVKTRSD